MNAPIQSGQLRVAEIRARRSNARIGSRIEFVESTTSTNDFAKKLLAEAPSDGLVVLADYQSAGRGRHHRPWRSPRGASVLCSVALVESSPVWDGGQLALLVGIAACDAIRRATDVTPTIKWPNDLMVRGRKLGGILVEKDSRSDGTVFIIGVGINCLQQAAHLEDDLGDRATSLEIESRQAIDRTEIAIALLSELERRVGDSDFRSIDALRAAWLDRAHPIGRRVILRHAGKTFQGTIIDVDPGAALIVQLDAGGVRAFNAASTTLLDYAAE